MEIINKKVSELIPYKNNPRINDNAVDAVAASIKEFGFQVPIVIDTNNVIVAGHTRYKAALQLGLDEVPCKLADELTPVQIKAFRLADNKVAELATWNEDLKFLELSELEPLNVDMLQFGFLPPPENLCDFDETDLDDNRVKDEFIITIKFDNKLIFENIKSELEKLQKSNSFSMAVKMQ